MGVFRFKKFNIRQDNTAMKIGTDGTFLGAWADVSKAKNILDIGTGTGLIAIMLAQRNNFANIKAIEINKNAIIDANYNIKKSPWLDRILLEKMDLKNYIPNKKLDLIVSNPPFFENSLKANSINRNNARHTDTLHYKDILKFTQSYLSKNGILSMILPIKNAEKCIEEAINYGLYLKRKTYLKPIPNKPSHRIAFELTTYEVSNIIENEIIIETGKRHDYTSDYIELTKAFYIIM